MVKGVLVVVAVLAALVLAAWAVGTAVLVALTLGAGVS